MNCGVWSCMHDTSPSCSYWSFTFTPRYLPTICWFSWGEACKQRTETCKWTIWFFFKPFLMFNFHSSCWLLCCWQPGGDPIVLCFVDFADAAQAAIALEALQGEIDELGIYIFFMNLAVDSFTSVLLPELLVVLLIVPLFMLLFLENLHCIVFWHWPYQHPFSHDALVLSYQHSFPMNDSGDIVLNWHAARFWILTSTIQIVMYIYHMEVM